MGFPLSRPPLSKEQNSRGLNPTRVLILKSKRSPGARCASGPCCSPPMLDDDVRHHHVAAIFEQWRYDERPSKRKPHAHVVPDFIPALASNAVDEVKVLERKVIGCAVRVRDIYSHVPVRRYERFDARTADVPDRARHRPSRHVRFSVPAGLKPGEQIGE